MTKVLLELREIIEKNTGTVCVGVKSEVINLNYSVWNDEIIIDDGEITIESDNLMANIKINKNVLLEKNDFEEEYILKNGHMNVYFNFIGV